MKFLSVSKDGGPKSSVWAYWLCEIKPLFSVALLKFDGASRPALHDHAFNCVSWVLCGDPLVECVHNHETGLRESINVYCPGLRPVVTRRDRMHKVAPRGGGRTWVLTFRGPWADTWREFVQGEAHARTLTHGRKEVPS